MMKKLFFTILAIFSTNLIYSAQPQKTKGQNKDLENFFKAARTGKVNDLKAFFKKGLTAKSKNRTGKTALMSAATSGNIKSFVTLLAHGADLYQTDKKGRNAIAYAQEYGHEDDIKAVLFVLTNLVNKNQIA